MILNRLNTKLLAFVLLFSVACQSDYPTYEGPNYIMFAQESYTLGILDSEEWFEIPISATRPTDSDRNIGVEIIDSESNAIESYHYVLEASTLRIAAGELTTAVRIKGLSENIKANEALSIKLRLVLDEADEWDIYGTETVVNLQKCCPTNLEAFTGYCKLTSSWLMQYLNTDSRLVRTRLSATEENTIIIEDMFYDGYDIKLHFNTDDRLNPTIDYDAQVAGLTGEAFGTIYGNGKLMMASPMGYTSYYGTCENFAVQYAMLYVEEVGTVGVYVNIFEWITDDEAERILREGF
ncbi:MAG: DUF4984 domain-containing protein [Alistipes sp.]|nr:DUF4984 domain-containing protein [Alistipes sp.]